MKIVVSSFVSMLLLFFSVSAFAGPSCDDRKKLCDCTTFCDIVKNDEMCNQCKDNCKKEYTDCKKKENKK